PGVDACRSMDHEVDFAEALGSSVDCHIDLFGVVEICVEHEHFRTLRMHAREPAEKCATRCRDSRVFTLRRPLTRWWKRAAPDQNQSRIQMLEDAFGETHSHVAQSAGDHHDRLL